MKEYKFYYPYPSDKNNKKFMVKVKKDNKIYWIYFGQNGYQHYTEGHLDEARRKLYVIRHKRNENWTDYNSPGFWSYYYLWKYKTYKEAYKNIIKKINII